MLKAKGYFKKEIIETIQKCNDVGLLDLIYKLLITECR